MLRALAFDFREDKNTYNISDQFMFGPSFLINPVTKPMYYDSGSTVLFNVEKSRDVYLPAGIKWYDFWRGKCYDGGQVLKSYAPLEILPIYIKAGSIIPMAPRMQHTGEVSNCVIELRIYPGADGEFRLYEDEGDNYNYEQGMFSVIGIQWQDKEKRLVIKERCGFFPGMADKREFKVVLVSEGHGNGVDETYTSYKLIDYDGDRMEIEFN